MSMNKMMKAGIALLFMFSIAGCGSEGDSETNGTLTLSAVAPVNAGTVTMTATAILTPGKVGSDISFTTYYFNAGGAYPTGAGCSGTQKTDPTGTATISCNFIQISDPATLQISATSGGLAAIPVSIPIPGL